HSKVAASNAARSVPRILEASPTLRGVIRTGRGWSPTPSIARGGISGCCLDSVRSGCSRGAGGAGGARTPDLRLAKAALSQLSYGPGLTRLVRPARQPRLPATAWRGGGPSWTRTRDLSLIRTAL